MGRIVSLLTFGGALAVSAFLPQAAHADPAATANAEASPSVSPPAEAPPSSAPTTSAVATSMPVNSGTAPDMRPNTQLQDNVRRHMGDFQAMAAQQRAFRYSMLGALTPAHRALLAQLIGEQSIAPAPNVQAAARRLDAALTLGETQAVLRIERARQAAALQQLQKIASDVSGHNVTFPTMQNANAKSMHTSAVAPFGSDAGSILLRTAALALLMPDTNMLQQLPNRLPQQLPSR